MKKLMSFLMTAFFVSCLFAQEKETKIDVKAVPEAVMKKSMAFYGDVKKVKWEKAGANYEATFKQNKVKASVILTPDGNIIEKEWQIKKTEVPKAVTDSITKNFAGYKVEEFSKVEKGGMLTYEAEVEGKKDGKEIELKLIYSADGKLLTTVEEKEDKEKKKE